jgi:hypothetical protein
MSAVRIRSPIRVNSRRINPADYSGKPPTTKPSYLSRFQAE